MSFIKYGSLLQIGGPILRKEILEDDAVVTVLDSVKIVSGNDKGFLVPGTAGESVFGHIMGIATNLDVGVSSTGASGAELGSFVGTYTASATNETVAKVRGEVDISQFTLYNADVDAALGTTTGSDQAGYAIDLADEDDLDEGSTLATILQYNIMEVTPGDTGNVIVNILQSHVFNTKSV